MINQQCITVTTDSKIKCDDRNNRCAIIVNSEKKSYNKIRVDGCAINDGVRADWAVEKGNAAIIIELKGKNVEHAADQVFRTAQFWTNEFSRSTYIAGLIVANQYPKSSTSIQLRQQKFAKKFRGPLHVVTKNDEFYFDKILSFKGPR